MLRPATPLAVLLFVAFALELLAVLSTPIVQAIPIASFQGIEYGVFGFCRNGACTSIKIGYPTSEYIRMISPIGGVGMNGPRGKRWTRIRTKTGMRKQEAADGKYRSWWWKTGTGWTILTSTSRR